MEIKLTSIMIENFCGIKNFNADFSKRNLITGRNGAGKSSLKKAIQFVFGCKDENGKEITGIRPHDENGIDIDGLTTVAEIGVSVDGQENTMKRVCFQEKNRQGEYTGKDNLQYFVDDVKKGTKKSYDEFVSSFLPNMVCISAQEFLSKDTAGRRETLSVFSEHDTDSVIDENPEFEPLRAKVKANSVADLKKACRDKIKAQTKERDAYPARIDELKKQKVDIDVAELELLKNSLNEQIAENKAKQADISKQFEEQQKADDGVLELKFELSDLERKANEELFKKRRDLMQEIDKKNSRISELKSDISDTSREIEGYEYEIEVCEKERQRLLDLWNKVKTEEFDENTAVCPTCHRKLPQDERERLLSTFEQSKAERITKIKKDGLEVKQDIENAKAMIPKLQQCNKDNLANKEKLEKEVADLEQQLSALPQSIDISDREDVKAIKQQIAEKEQAMNKANSGAEIRKQLQSKCEDLQSQLAETNSKIDLAENNIKIDERIEGLRAKQRELSQEIADVEKELSLLRDFERKKAELLENDVNKHFELVKFKMFEKQITSDELRDVCQILVDGESFDHNLNFSNKILAEIDICRAFQKHYGIVAPILADNIESVDPQRIPRIENQLILFGRSDEPQLTIKNLED